MGEKLLTGQIVQILGLSPEMVRILADKGELGECERVGPRNLRVYNADAVEACRVRRAARPPV